MKNDRIYCDTSVFGGCFDSEFSVDSKRFFHFVQVGRITLLVSEVVVQEIEDAPKRVREFFTSLPQMYVERVQITEEIIDLRNAYITEKIIGPRWIDDATHVAAATVSRADAIVSWNFSHIVRLDRMKGYNRTNLMKGYGILSIITPKEIRYEEKDEKY